MSSIPNDAMPRAQATPETEADAGRVKRVAKVAGGVAKKAGSAAADQSKSASDRRFMMVSS